VIAALNANMPFDQFTIEQLAGDLLPGTPLKKGAVPPGSIELPREDPSSERDSPLVQQHTGPTIDQQIATGFHRNHPMNNESGIIDEEYRLEYVADRTDTTGTVWLGLTVGCARCHDHKYDPLTQQEYYQLFAFFNNLPEKGLIFSETPPEPALMVLSLSDQSRRQELKDLRSLREKEFAAFDTAVQQELANWEALAQNELPKPNTERLLAHFDFDDRLTDDGGRDVAASANGPLRYKDGFRKMALEFDSSQHVDLPSGLKLDPNGPWTISFWIRPLLQVRGTCLSFAPAAGIALKKGTVPPGNANLRKEGQPLERDSPLFQRDSTIPGLHIVSQRLQIAVSLVGGTGEGAISVTTVTPLKPAAWQQVAIVYDGSERAAGIAILVDGAPVETAILHDGPWQAITQEVSGQIGRREGIGGLNGRIDELQIFGRNLSPVELLDEYARQVVGGILQTAADKRNATQKLQLQDYLIRKHASPEVRAAWRSLAAARRQEAEFEAGLPTTLVMREMEKPRPTFVLDRGQYDKPTDPVSAAVPAWLPPLPAGEPANRLALARWLVSPENPLTARVTVNRYWQHFFGEGLVKTSNDFGIQGEFPSHPELLDWLAVRFVSSGWNVKALHKLIVMSAVYRQSAACSPQVRQLDPENRLLARGPRLRLGAEAIRDQALFASGLLVEHLGGPSVKPYQPAGLWEAVSYNAEQSYVPGLGSDLYRRGLYIFWKRQAPPPSMLSFDGPTRETCVVKRPRTNTPLQALVLQNDPTYVEAARVLATDLMRQQAADLAVRIRIAFRPVVGREPDQAETGALSRLFEAQLAEYRANPAAVLALVQVGDSPAPVAVRPRVGLGLAKPQVTVVTATLDPVELAAWTTVVSTLLNLDETITKP
jgi:hypothetical protein